MENWIGKTLGRYQIVAKLSAKATAELYKAYQPDLKLSVAIKLLPRPLAADPQYVARFEREALTMGKLHHPNIIQVLDFDMDGDICFLVMQLVNGPTLKEEFKARRRQRSGFSLAELGRIYLALGEAVDYIHSQRIIHRNLKPGNVMISDSGQVLLTGFGIARFLEGNRPVGPGVVVGTPAYMSPEQGRGEPVDERSDIYTLGVILYELITGRAPYKGDTPTATIKKHLTDPVPSPRQANLAVPEAVEGVVMKAMHKQPQERFQSAEELALALREAVGLKTGDTLWQHPLKPVALTPDVEQA